jgi:hypothetical protein
MKRHSEQHEEYVASAWQQVDSSNWATHLHLRSQSPSSPNKTTYAGGSMIRVPNLLKTVEYSTVFNFMPY